VSKQAFIKAREAFNEYAALDGNRVPHTDVEMSALQVRLARWGAHNFGAQTTSQMALGIAEEIGELAEAQFAQMLQEMREQNAPTRILTLALAAYAGSVAHNALKADQRIRTDGDVEKFREKMADAIADQAVFTMQLCTLMRLDYGTILEETAEHVMLRDWKQFPKNGRNE